MCVYVYVCVCVCVCEREFESVFVCSTFSMWVCLCMIVLGDFACIYNVFENVCVSECAVCMCV